MSKQEVQRSINRLDSVRDKIEHVREHREHDLRIAKKSNTIPELESGDLPDWRLGQLTDYERALYYIGRAEGKNLALLEIEAGLEGPDEPGD